MQKFSEKNKRFPIKNYLPHNFLAEKMILSCLLINSEAIDSALQTISIETFYFKNHQELYKAIIFMHKNKRLVDIVTLTTFLQDNGLLEEVGGIKVLIELINQVPNLTYLDEYIKLIQDKYIRRSLIKLGYKAINSGYITNIPFKNIVNEFENSLFKLTNEVKNQNISNTSELLKNIFLELKEKSIKPKLPGIASGFYDLDCLTQGLQKSDLIIIAGRPSIGKTALCLNIGLNIIKNLKLPVLFFSLEMSKEQLMYRILSIETNINQIRLRSGNLYQNDWIKLNKIIKILSKLPLFLDDTTNISTQDIRSKIKKVLFEQNEIGLVIIDYLQLMQNSKFKIDNRVQELSQITRLLKSLAREFNVPIIALSQLSRSIENRVNKRPILSDLRESGSIEQDADLVLMLSQIKSNNLNINNDVIELIIAKQRNGPTGSFKLRFDKKRTKFNNFNLIN